MPEPNIGLLILLGLSLLGGTIGAWFFQHLRIPQVVGYIVIGLLLGQVGLGAIRPEDIVHLRPLNLFALGIIGFLVGGELKIETFRKYAKQFMAILLGEGLGAFFLVGAGSFAFLYILFGDMKIAAAAAVVFGAIASATDPASTIDVLWEYRARGILTTSITAIVALDDALAMTLYGLGTGMAQMFTSGNADFGHEIAKFSQEIFGALLVGFLFAIALVILLRSVRQAEKALAVAIGLILLLIGVSILIDLDIILAAMTLGFTLVNVAPRVSKDVFKLMRGFSMPIYVLFFVLVGARLNIASLPLWLWGIVAIYVVGRNGGKMLGAWIGARISGSTATVRKYMGMGLFAQGGVAVGLSIMASQHLTGIQVSDGLSLGDTIIFAITATTMIVQLSGPPLVKLAIQRAGEIGQNVTDEDVIAEMKVADAMDKDIQSFREDMRLTDAVKAFAQTEYSVIPVINSDNRLIGTVSLQGMRDVLADHDSWEWLLVSDILDPLSDKTNADAPLKEVIEFMNMRHIPQMPVISSNNGDSPVGMLDLGRVKKRVADEILRRHKEVED